VLTRQAIEVECFSGMRSTLMLKTRPEPFNVLPVRACFNVSMAPLANVVSGRAWAATRRVAKEECSFLKKRTKKLLLI